MKKAMSEMERRRRAQEEYNRVNGITSPDREEGAQDSFGQLCEMDWSPCSCSDAQQEGQGRRLDSIADLEAEIAKVEAQMRTPPPRTFSMRKRGASRPGSPHLKRIEA
ncbi:MAG: hypothetical protein U0166_14690 [Acidobacteriota bacterium]